MNDNQKTAVLAAMTAVNEPMTTTTSEFLTSACEALSLSPPPRITSGGFEVSGSGLSLPERCGSMTVLHSVAHLATPRVFPSHGAEFCAILLRVATAMTPYHAELLRQEFDSRGIHYSPDHRRRAVIKAVTQRASDGTRLVEAIFDSPPERVEGAMTYRRGSLTIASEVYDLARLRYLAKVA
jgi:hypothetical protein